MHAHTPEEKSLGKKTKKQKKHCEAFWRLPRRCFKETVKYESAVVLGTPTTALIPQPPPPLLKRGLCACRAPISYLLTGRA